MPEPHQSRSPRPANNKGRPKSQPDNNRPNRNKPRPKPNDGRFKAPNTTALPPKPPSTPVQAKPLPPIPTAPPEYVVVAQVAAPFGLRGAVKADIRTDFPERFERMEEAFLIPPDAPPSENRLVKIMSARLQSDKQVILRFEGISKIEEAEKLRGYTVAVPLSDVVELPEDEYYVFQIIGLDVYSLEDEFVGQVINVLNYPANDVYIVRGPLSKDDVLIPAIKDVVKNIDLEAKRITIDLMEGLI